MSYILRFSMTAACLAALSAVADAQTLYSTTFDNLDRQLALSQQDGWFTNDAYVAATDAGQSDVVGLVTFYSATTDDYWGLLGGLSPFKPGLFSVEVARGFNSAGVLLDTMEANILRFGVDFAITSSGSPRPNRDRFGWNFHDAEGDLLFRLALEPDSEVAADGLRLRFYDSQGVATSTPNSIAYDAIYGLQVDVSLAGAGRDALTVSMLGSNGLVTTSLDDVDLPDGTAASLAQIGAHWDIVNPSTNVNGDPDAYGSNSMLFNNFKVAVVPEPSAALLLGIGSLFVANRRLRRASR